MVKKVTRNRSITRNELFFHNPDKDHCQLHRTLVHFTKPKSIVMNLNLNPRALIVFLLLSIACNTTSVKENNEEKTNGDLFEASSTSPENDEKIKSQIERLIKKLPPPSEIPRRLQSSGLTYREDLLKSLSDDRQSTTKENICVNLGMNLVDVSYQVSYGNMQEALTNLKSSQKLADEINISTSFDIELMRKFEENIEDGDELNRILDAEVEETNKYLRSNYRTEEAVLVLAGSLIESLYLTTQQIRDFEGSDSNKIAENITILQEVTGNIINLFRLLENQNPDFELLVELKRLQLMFDDFKTDDLSQIDLNGNEFRPIIEQSEKIRNLV